MFHLSESSCERRKIILSAFSFFQNTPGPLILRFKTLLIALSTVPLPIGMPFGSADIVEYISSCAILP
jgi:hypothetical protein